MEKNAKTLADYFDTIRRRKSLIIITWLLISVISVVVAYFLPKNYRSTAILLIEAPLPTNLFEASASRYADEQVQSLYQRVLTTDNTHKIIEKTGLYNDLVADGATPLELAELFKENLDVSLTATTLAPKTSSGVAEIAFDVSFFDENPAMAQKVASELTSLFIQQNDSSRTQRAAKASEFLNAEADKFKVEIKAIDDKIAEFKEEHNFSLPEQAQANMAAIDRAENELRDADRDIRATKDRLAILSAELARMPKEDVTQEKDIKPGSEKHEDLATLKQKYNYYASIYSPSHPTLTRLSRQIKLLDPSFDGRVSSADVASELSAAKDKLQALRQEYAESHPSIEEQKKLIAKLEKHLGDTGGKAASGHAPQRASNPAYIELQVHYQSSQSELTSLLDKKEALKAKIENLHNLLQMAPAVEKEYNNLLRERDSTVKKYNQLKEKSIDARVIQTQEQNQQGQTLTIIEEAAVPVHPEKAIRRKVAIGGFLGGLLLGLSLAFMLDIMSPGLRGYRAVAQATGIMPIIVIPYLETPSEENKKFAKLQQESRVVWLALSAIIITATALIIYFSPWAKA